jgi:hypothetical protein
MTIQLGNGITRFQEEYEISAATELSSRPERSVVERSAVSFYSQSVLPTVDYTGFHHEGDVLEHADVVEGIAGDGDDVGVVAGLERA